MVETIPLEARPRFARKMVGVWRWHHLARGEDLTVVVWPGEWPAGAPREVVGADVTEMAFGGAAGGMFVLGRVGATWKGAYQIAHPLIADLPTDLVAVTCAFVQVDPTNPDMTMWLHPDPKTGQVPMWSIRRDRTN